MQPWSHYSHQRWAGAIIQTGSLTPAQAAPDHMNRDPSSTSNSLTHIYLRPHGDHVLIRSTANLYFFLTQRANVFLESLRWCLCLRLLPPGQLIVGPAPVCLPAWHRCGILCGAPFHLEKLQSSVRIVFFDFSSAFNTCAPQGVDHQLSSWITNCRSN